VTPNPAALASKVQERRGVDEVVSDGPSTGTTARANSGALGDGLVRPSADGKGPDGEEAELAAGGVDPLGTVAVDESVPVAGVELGESLIAGRSPAID
jgi:hypothetical protein